MANRAVRLLVTAIVASVLATGHILSYDVRDVSGQNRVGTPDPVPRELHVDSFAEIVKGVKDSVVNIMAIGVEPRRKLGRQQEPPHVDGSGVIIDPTGYVITNDHVIDQARTIRVRLSDDEEYEARLVGRDPWTDLALLKIQPSRHLTAAVLGDSDRVRVGDWVLAIGNPFGLEHSVSAGIVSAKGRVLGEGPDDDFVQTDAATNPGSSGGPLFDLRGEVVGIHNIGYGETDKWTGISLAIPINLVKEVISQLRANGRVTRAALGLGVLPVSAELAKKLKRATRDGVVVAKVQPRGPAARAGVREGDLVVGFQGHSIQRPNELARLVSRSPVGGEVRLSVVRGGASVDVKVTLGELQGRPTHGKEVRPIGYDHGRLSPAGSDKAAPAHAGRHPHGRSQAL